MNSTRRWQRVTTILVSLCGASLILWFTLSKPRSTPDPMTNGRPLTQWLAIESLRTNKTAADLALVTLGKKAVPTLRTMLQSGNKAERLWSQNAPRWLYLRLPFGWRSYDEKDRAMAALELLGKDGHDAAPDLITILSDPSEHLYQRRKALTTLRSIRAEDSVVLPVLDALVGDPVIGNDASREARLRRDYAERMGSSKTARTRASSSADVPIRYRKNTDSFLGNVSLWSAEGTKHTSQPNRSNPILGTNMPAR
jgi:hypothetical protein